MVSGKLLGQTMIEGRNDGPYHRSGKADTDSRRER